MVSQTSSPASYPPNGLVLDRGGAYLPPDSRVWMMRFRYKGRLIRQSSKTTVKRQAIAALRRRMAEFGVECEGHTLEVPTLREAADALLAHILATKKSGFAQVRTHLRSLLTYFGSDTRCPKQRHEDHRATGPRPSMCATRLCREQVLRPLSGSSPMASRSDIGRWTGR